MNIEITFMQLLWVQKSKFYSPLLRSCQCTVSDDPAYENCDKNTCDVCDCAPCDEGENCSVRYRNFFFFLLSAIMSY